MIMGFNFRRRISIAPGVRLNLSKGGTSWSFGRPGARITFGKRPSATVGIPGSGMSYTQPLEGADRGAPVGRGAVLLALLIVFLFIIL